MEVSSKVWEVQLMELWGEPNEIAKHHGDIIFLTGGLTSFFLPQIILDPILWGTALAVDLPLLYLLLNTEKT